MSKTKVEIWTDGSSDGKSGGYAAILVHPRKKLIVYGPLRPPLYTNNQAEMMGAIRGLQQLKTSCFVVVYSDSQLLCKGYNEWMPRWKRRGWRKADGDEVKNQKLWRLLDEVASPHAVVFQWVRGHSTNDLNNDADRFAKIGCVLKKEKIKVA